METMTPARPARIATAPASRPCWPGNDANLAVFAVCRAVACDLANRNAHTAATRIMRRLHKITSIDSSQIIRINNATYIEQQKGGAGSSADSPLFHSRLLQAFGRNNRKRFCCLNRFCRLIFWQSDNAFFRQITIFAQSFF